MAKQYTITTLRTLAAQAGYELHQETERYTLAKGRYKGETWSRDVWVIEGAWGNPTFRTTREACQYLERIMLTEFTPAGGEFNWKAAAAI